MRFDGERIRRTDMVTFAYGKSRIVYADIDKVDEAGEPKLYFKFGGRLFGTFKTYCRRVK